MSETTPPGPRHARSDESVPSDASVRPHDAEPPTTAIPTLIPGEFTDDVTQAIPIIPAQRGAGAFVPAQRPSPTVFPPDRAVPHDTGGRDLGQPVGPQPVARRRRVLPVVLACVTACLLAAGIVVGVGGAGGADMTDQPSVSTTP